MKRDTSFDVQAELKSSSEDGDRIKRRLGYLYCIGTVAMPVSSSSIWLHSQSFFGCSIASLDMNIVSDEDKLTAHADQVATNLLRGPRRCMHLFRYNPHVSSIARQLYDCRGTSTQRALQSEGLPMNLVSECQRRQDSHLFEKECKPCRYLNRSMTSTVMTLDSLTSSPLSSLS